MDDVAAPGPLSKLALAMMDDLGRPPEPLRERWTALRDGLCGPLRVAVVGRLKAGKSTLVNALLGQVVAATGAGECTLAVSRVRYGFPERVEAGADASRDVYLSNEILRTLTIIDTPGLDSVHEAVSRATWDLLEASGPEAALGTADALILVVNDRLADADLDALGLLSGRRNADFALAVSCLGVLTRVDLFADDGDVDEHARAVAAAHAGRLREHVSDVMPVFGLLAEAAEAGRLTEADAGAVAVLAGLADDVVAVVLADADEFRTDGRVGLTDAARERLIERLGMFGLREAVRLHRGGARGAAALTTALSHRSGIGALRGWMLAEFAEKGDALRVSRTLGQLFELSYHAHDDVDVRAFLDRLRDVVEELRLSPRLHRLEELRARQAVRSDAVRLPEPWRTRFLDLTAAPASSRPDVIDRRADGGTPDQWHHFALTAALSQQWIAQVALRSLVLGRTDPARLTPSITAAPGDDNDQRPPCPGTANRTAAIDSTVVTGYRLRDLVHLRRRAGGNGRAEAARPGW